jgi:hypothetical protein
MSKSNQRVEAKLDENTRSKQETRVQVEEQTSVSIKEGPSYSNANPKDWNTFVTEEIRRFLIEFQGIKIVVTPGDADEMVFLFVHPPYMLQSVTIVDDEKEFTKLPRRHQIRLKKVEEARENAPNDVKEFLYCRFYGAGNQREAAVAKGRAELEDMRRLLQEAVDQGLVPVPEGRPYPGSSDLRNWLKKYGIGVDCSAFVQQTLTRLVRACYAAIGDNPDRGHSHSVGWMTSKGVYRDIMADPGKGERFEKVSTPGEARPGDVLVKWGHIRIVASAETAKEGGVILDLAESTSARDIPLGQASEEADIGPRLIQVRYPEPNSPISKQTPLRRRLGEDEFRADREERVYSLGRFRALDQFCREHQAPEATAASPGDLGALPRTDVRPTRAVNHDT